MTKPIGRPNGLILHAEAFEAILIARNLLKKDAAAHSGVSAQFFSDLLAKRSGASKPKAEAIARALGVPVAAIFPEASGWVSPLPDRNNTFSTRKAAA